MRAGGGVLYNKEKEPAPEKHLLLSKGRQTRKGTLCMIHLTESSKPDKTNSWWDKSEEYRYTSQGGTREWRDVRSWLWLEVAQVCA